MYRCKECHGENVQEKCWINVNTGKHEGLVDEEGECWCEDCEELVEIYEETDENNNN